MKYTAKMVEETIRLANIAPMVFRTATQDVEYKGIEFEVAYRLFDSFPSSYLFTLGSLLGYLIPKGWRVMLWIRYLYTNPENFTDPMCFNPDR
ncbi:Ent-kaurenoic acid oxidase [Bertholletia excelsa]